MASPRLHVLHLDDNPFELEKLAASLDPELLQAELAVESESDVRRFRQRLGQDPVPDLIILDVDLGSATTGGTSLVQETRGLAPDAVILMFSSLDDVPTVVSCMSQGADDFLSKQSDRSELNLRVRRCYQIARHRRSGDAVTVGAGSLDGRTSGYAGDTMDEIARKLPALLETKVPGIHVLGETGSGKDVVAAMVTSAVRASPIVRFDCDAVAPDEQAAALFERPRRLFLWGHTDRRSLAERAAGGWLFLDAVECLAPPAQHLLVRAIRGGTFRVLSMASDPLDFLVEEAQFDAGLAASLRTVEVSIPPLRDRPGDIGPIACHLARGLPGGPYTISDTALDVLSTLPWRAGNVRELGICLGEMARLHVNHTLTPLSLPASVWQQRDQAAVPTTTPMGWEFEERQDMSVLRFCGKRQVSAETCADVLLLELIRKLTRDTPTSLRKVARCLRLSRAELAERLDGMVARCVISREALNTLVRTTRQ